MTLTAIPGFFVPVPPNGNNFLLPQDLLIDDSAEKVALILRAPKTGTLKRFEFLLDAVAQAPANGLRVSFQNLDAIGNPDGTQDEFRVVTAGLTAATWVTPGIMSSDGSDTGTKRSVTAGDVFACVIEFESFEAGDSLEIRGISADQAIGATNQNQRHFTTAWADNGNVPIAALQYDDDSYPVMMGVVPYASLGNSLNLNTDSTPDEVALRLRFPVEVAIGGFALMAVMNAAGRAYDVILYDDGDNVVETQSFDTDDQVNAQCAVAGMFATAHTIPANTTYRLALKPTTTGNISVSYFEVPSNAHFAQHPGGIELYYSERTDGGAWTDITTRRLEAAVLVTKIHDGAGGGGGGIRLAGRGGLIGRA